MAETSDHNRPEWRWSDRVSQHPSRCRIYSYLIIKLLYYIINIIIIIFRLWLRPQTTTDPSEGDQIGYHNILPDVEYIPLPGEEDEDEDEEELQTIDEEETMDTDDLFNHDNVTENPNDVIIKEEIQVMESREENLIFDIWYSGQPSKFVHNSEHLGDDQINFTLLFDILP